VPTSSFFEAFNEIVYSAEVLQINIFLSIGNILKMHLTVLHETQWVTGCDTDKEAMRA
jgi:hypothetical protein